MRPPRMTIRTLMIAVAVVALCCVGVQTYRRRAFCVDRADLYAVLETTYRAAPVESKKFGRLRRDFERAARYPWLPIPAEPPQEEWVDLPFDLDE
jgi:hypothetical protein